MMQLLYKPLLINYQIFVAVSKVESNVGDSVNISWTAPFFPRAGAYTVYHTGNVNRSIIVVTSSGATFDQTKYEYQSRPFDSTNINFTIKDVSRTDAGYYNGGLSPEAAWSGGGVVLIVHGEFYIIIYTVNVLRTDFMDLLFLNFRSYLISLSRCMFTIPIKLYSIYKRNSDTIPYN